MKRLTKKLDFPQKIAIAPLKVHFGPYEWDQLMEGVYWHFEEPVNNFVRTKTTDHIPQTEFKYDDFQAKIINLYL